MPHYRIYFLDNGGRIARAAEVVDCEDDEQAQEAARQVIATRKFIDGKDIEVWQGVRRVARITRQ